MRSDYVLLVLGQRRSGKTTLTFGGDPIGEGVIDHTRARRTFVYDERGTVPGRSSWLRYETAADLQEWLLAEARGHPEARTPGAYYVRPKVSDSKAAFWDLVSPGITNGQVKDGVPGVYFVDEAHRVARARKKTAASFKEAIESGGNDNMSFVLATRRYTRLDVDVRTQASAILSFRQPPEEIKEMERSFDRRASTVRQLEGHQFTVFGEATDELPFIDFLKSRSTYVAP